jgi:Ca-activated chloride channel family protein
VFGTVPVIASSVRRILSSLILLSAVCFTATFVAGQSAIDDVHIAPREKPVDVASAAYSAPYSDDSVIRSNVDLVLVPVTITDDLNRPVLGLNQQNFELFENKHRREIKNFSSEDAPVSIGILVDTSRSMAYKLDRAREAVQQFCDMANPEDEFFLITFADEPQLVTDFTSHSGNISNALVTIRSNGQTSLLDAIYMGVQKMRDARYGRKALLIVSDGGDNHSRYTEHDVKSAIRESDVTLYAIGTYERWVSTQEELLGPDLLRTLAQSTGGVAFSLEDANQMPVVGRNIGDRLRHQYVLTYEPESRSHDGKWHKISVKLRLPKKFAFLHVNARPGYYSGGE